MFVFLKSAATLTLVFLAIHCSIAQSPEYTFAVNTAKLQGNEAIALHTNSKNEAKLTAAHRQTARRQVQVHLANTMTYPVLMEKNGIEGFMIIEIEVGKYGEVLESKIHKSLHPAFDKQALEAMKSMKMIKTNEVSYRGPKRILARINFSL